MLSCQTNKVRLFTKAHVLESGYSQNLILGLKVIYLFIYFFLPLI